MSEIEQGKTEQAIGADPMAEFYTREASNDGVKLPLYTVYNERTDHWLRVLGADSDAFRDAELRAKREGMQVAAIQDPAERSRETRALQNRLLAAAVVAWSFPKPCTFDNVVAFLGEAPQIADAIDTLISRRSLFFAKRSIDSLPTPSKSSSST